MALVGRSGVSLTIRDTGPIKSFGDLRLDITVGIQPEDVGEKHHSGLTIGEVAAVHEFGSAVANIPARMWFRRWADAYTDRLRAAVRGELQQMVRTQRVAPGALQNIVHRARATLVGRIAAGAIMPPNAPATLARKAPETRPLVETRQFMRAITGAFRASTRGGNAGALSWRYKTPRAGGGGGAGA